MRIEFVIALGSNADSRWGGSDQTVLAALSELRERFPDNFEASKLYETPCFPAGAGPDYVNAACRFACELSPETLLSVLHQIEEKFARVRELRWGQRTLDLDLLAAEDRILPNVTLFNEWKNAPLERQRSEAPDQLILPHPRLHERAFVLKPLADVAANWTHPVLGTTVADMLADLPEDEIAQIKQIAPRESPCIPSVK